MDESSGSEPLLPKNTHPDYKRRQHRARLLSGLGAATLALLLISTLALYFATKDVGHTNEYHGRLVSGEHAAVAVEAEECSAVGVETLKNGGNAVDAAIASALCIGVIGSYATGIGGGGFMLIRSPNGTYEFVDFRETAPGAAHQDMFVDNPDLAKYGGLAVGVPGELRGFELAHQRHGKLPWAMLFEPAIRIARDGFKTTKLLEKRLKAAESWLMGLPDWVEVFAPNGTLAAEGDIIRRTQLAKTLEKVAREGADAFYIGELAESLVNATRAAGGIMTIDDMANYRALIRPAVSTYYHGRKVTTCTTPTSGPLIIAVLNLLEQYNLAIKGYTGLNAHRIIEALKYGYAVRTEFGDPDYTLNWDRINEILSKEWAAHTRQNISDDATHDPLYYGPKFDHIENHGTMHLSVVDEENGAVALTSTVNLLFGARFMDPVTGVILNDEMDDFSIPGKPNAFGLYPSKYNYAAPGKRPLSSITPTIVEQNGEFELAVGASGGSAIPTSTLNVLLNVIDFGHNLYEAVEAPRYHHQLLPNLVLTEPTFNTKISEELESRGHQTFLLSLNQTGTAVQAVMRMPNQSVHAVSDPRKFGIAAAY
ncbi:nucleophile aminohydrolase [Dichotomocladium elegans]|nr:nucleophile aminohydrolase [Dichotomocladium elegans]